ncbi:MAG: hypothetical protein WBV22_06060 [Anaerolineaceae bacterium]
MGNLHYTCQELYSAQISIIDDLVDLEGSIRSIKNDNSEINIKISNIVKFANGKNRPLSDKEKTDIGLYQNEILNNDYAIKILRYGRWLYRYVGDGIAWRIYKYNREAIRALGNKESVPFISKQEGISKEIKIFKAIRSLGRKWLPLMHDITNCLRTADFSIFYGGKLYRIIELKIRNSNTKVDNSRGKKSYNDARQIRQEKHLDNIFKFWQTGNLEFLDAELIGGISIKSKIPEKYNFRDISKVIRLARKKGFGYTQIEYGLLYIAWDMYKSSIDDAIREVTIKYPHIFETLMTFRAIYPRYNEYHLSLPITAMEISAKDIIGLIFNKFGLVCLLNYQCVEEYLNKNGLPIHFEIKNNKLIRIITKTIPLGEVREGLWDRIFFEGLSLDTFNDLIKEIIKEKELEPIM